MAVISDYGVALDDGPLIALAEAGEGAGLRVLAPNDADPAALAAQANRFALIGVTFPKSADGRGFSIAKRLRDLGYRGRLRAVGHLIPDQFAYARACGFDEVQVDDALAARQGAAVWEQAGAQALPPFRRRMED